MKFGKDEIQKVVLGLLLLAALLYGYFNLMLAPLAKSEAGAKAAITALGPEIAGAQTQRTKTQALEAKAPVATGRLEAMKGLIPSGAPIAWFPPRMAEFFKRQGIDKCSTRLNGESADKSMPGFRRLSWIIDLQKVEFVPLAIAVAGLENEEPLLQITNIQIEANPGDPQFQHTLLTVSTIVNQ